MFRIGDLVTIAHESGHSDIDNLYKVVGKEMLGWVYADDGMYAEYTYHLEDANTGEGLERTYSDSKLVRVRG